MKVAVINPQILLVSLKLHDEGIQKLDEEKTSIENELRTKAIEIQKLIEEVNKANKNTDLFWKTKVKRIEEGQVFLKEKQQNAGNMLKEKEENILFECSQLVSEIVEEYCTSHNIELVFSESAVAYVSPTIGGSITDSVLQIFKEKDLLNNGGISYLESKLNLEQQNN